MKWRKYPAVLLTALCVGLTGCGITDVVNNESRFDYEAQDKAVVYPAQTQTVKKDAATEKILSAYQLALQNDYLELYIGENYDIIVYEKNSGKLTFSNEIYQDMDSSQISALNAAAKNIMMSQVAVEYYNSSLKKTTMTSYPDAYSENKNQVTWGVDQDTLTVSYGIGTNMEESPLIPIFTQETFEGYLSKLQELKDNGEITAIQYRDFANNYSQYTYETMKSEDQKRYLEMYPKLPELGTIYVIKDLLNNRITNTILEIYTKLGIDEEVKQAEAEKLGESVNTMNPAFFRIPVCYRLSGPDLLVSVDTDKIETTEGYYLTKVELMKCFGATKEDEAGYLFYPDGSGAITENNIVSNSMDRVNILFYGKDQAVQASDALNNTLPVFGIKKEDHAFLAIVENGAAVGGMTAQVHGSYLNYNIAYPFLDYNVVDIFGIQGVSLAFYKNHASVDYTVRYHFLNGDDADYTGMAAYYQKYLVQTGVLKERTEQDQTLGLDVELIGSTNKTINNFGIPIEENYAMTTFAQAQEIMEILHQDGISDIDVIYSGAINGGMEQKALSKIKVQKELGGLKGWQKLESYLDSSKDTLFLGMDPTRIAERGNGVRKKEDVSKYLTKSSVMVSPQGNVWGMNSAMEWLINPFRYQDITDKFIKAQSKMGTQKLYLESVGAYLNGNYSAERGMTRQTAQMYTTQMLAQLVDAGYSLKLDAGNDYVLKYADSLVNVPTTSSHQRLESYSIPFVGMVLKGYLPFTCTSVNQSGNMVTALLEAVESGAGLNYLLVYNNQLELVDTNYESLFSVNYKTQIEEILENYRVMNEKMGYLQNERIIRHEHLTENVNCVTYADGTKVYVNYGKEAYKTSDQTVEALSWLVVGR